MKLKEKIRFWFLKLLLRFKKTSRIPGEDSSLTGLVPSPEDKRDWKAKEFLVSAEDKPDFFVLPIRGEDYVKQQGSWNSCASHAITTAVEILHSVDETNLQVPLSERHHYYIARQERINDIEYQGNFPDNAGMYSRTMLKVAQNIGLTPEKLCPYISSKMNEDPGQFAHGFASMWKIKHYYRIWDMETAKDWLLDKKPILLGVKINKSFRTRTGKIEVINGEGLFGGHEIVIYGYDNVNKEFLCVNSWGKSYKENGLMRVPYTYINKYLIDMWSIKK